MQYIDEACWKGYQQFGMKDKGGRQVPNCVPIKEAEGYCEQCLVEYIKEAYATDKPEMIEIMEPGLNEAEYQGRKVQLGKPSRGDSKKFKVYVKNDKGNVVKVNFGHGGTSAKKLVKKQCVYVKVIQHVADHSEPDIVVKLQAHVGKQDIGRVVIGDWKFNYLFLYL
jgi:hypothetical protein